MAPILVLYATREGQTRKIAEHVADAFRKRGLSAEMLDAAELPTAFALGRYRAAVLAASVHAGKHEREMVKFVKAHRAELERIPTVFLSSSLSEAGAEDQQRSPEARDKAKTAVQGMIDQFLKDTEWHPSVTRPVAGALLYTQYGPIIRFVMKRISKAEGGSTDTSRDHEYTDWAALDRFIDELVLDGFRNAG